jgi:hypothetical protein
LAFVQAVVAVRCSVDRLTAWVALVLSGLSFAFWLWMVTIFLISSL